MKRPGKRATGKQATVVRGLGNRRVAGAKSKAAKTSEKKSADKPRPREVLFAPWRREYIETTAREDDAACVFCKALEEGPSLESLVVFKGKHCSVILNKYPYNNGHTMIIPHRHTAEFESLQKEEFQELHELLKRAFTAISRAYGPHGMNIGMNLGRVGGAGILGHLHYHLVPRWNGDTNFMPVVAQTKVVSEGLEQTYKKLVALFS